MRYIDYNEPIQHGTPEQPIAWYHVDEKHPRYHMAIHWHLDYEIVRVLSGSLTLSIDNARVCAREGDLVFIGKGAVHGGEPDGSVYECVVFDPAALLKCDMAAPALTPLLAHSIHLNWAVCEAHRELLSLTDRLFACAEAPEEARGLLAAGYLMALFGTLATLDAHPLKIEPLFSRQKAEHLEPALDYIDEHFREHISLDELARLTGMSGKYFCRYFRAIIHRSPIDYLNFYRVEQAGALLVNTEMTVAEVAYHCGFNDSSFFIKQFRHYKAMTPGQYRDQLRKDEPI